MRVVCEITDKPSYVAQILLQMSMSEKCNTLHRLLHFNFWSICDRSVVSLTPSGDPQPICCRPPKPKRVGGGDTFDWWWCELNRKRWRESFYQGRNTSGLKCSCTSPLYNAAAGPRITRRQKPKWETLVIVAPAPTWNFTEAAKQDRNTENRAEDWADTKGQMIYLNSFIWN